MRPARLGPVPAGRHGLSPEQVDASRRARLIDSTLHLVGQGGCHDLRVADIVADARVRRSAFFALLGDREGALVAALAEGYARIHAAIADGEAGEAGADRVHAAVDRALGLLDEQPGVARLCIVEHVAAGPRSIPVRRAAMERLARLLEAVDGRSRLTAIGSVGAAFEILAHRLTATEATPVLAPLADVVTRVLIGPGDVDDDIELEPAPRSRRRDEPALTHVQAAVVAHLTLNPRSSNRAVGAATGLSPSRASRVLAQLARQGLLTGSREGRERAWRVTAAGARALGAHRRLTVAAGVAAHP